MFDFLGMVGNHDDRKVDQYNQDGLFIDTCFVTDGEKPYETAVEHPYYNNGKMVIVEAYDTKEESQAGHNKWVRIMTSPSLPASLKDCQNAGISKLADLTGLDMEFPITIDTD